MKEGWKIVKLGEVCESRLGKTLNSSTDIGKPYEYLCAVNIQWDKIDLSILKTTLFSNEEVEKYKIQKGDLLVCEGGEAGRAAIWDDEKTILYQNALHRIRFKNNVMLPRFCMHYLRKLKFEGIIDKNYARGATIKHLVTKSLYSIPIPLPPLEEQHRIVGILDAAFAKIDALKKNAEENLANAKALFQQVLTQELKPKEGWVEKKLTDISENLDYKRIPITKNVRKSGKFPYYGASGIVDYVNDYLYDEDLLLISEDGANLLARTTPIAFSVSGKIWVNNHAHVLRFNNLTLQKFVEYFIAGFNITPYVTGMAQPKLNQKALEKIIISFPTDIEEQHRIVSTLDTLSEKCRRLEQVAQQTIRECDALKQSILRKAFSGEL